MAELSEEQEQKETAESANVVSKGNERGSKNGLWFGVVIMLIVIALAAGGYMLLQQLREKQEGLGGQITKDDSRMMELTKQITGYQSQLAAIQTQIANLDSDISGKENHFNKKLSDFSGLHQQKLDATEKSLVQAVKQIQRQLGKTRGDWLIADAEYLLSVANQRLHLTGDISTTLEALEAADQRLRESGDAAVYKVRAELTKEIAAIKKVKLPDIVGIYSILQSLGESIDKLTLFLPFSGKGLSEPESEPKQAETKDQGKDSQDTGNDLLNSALEELGDLVTVRHTETPIKAILTAEEVYFIQQQLMVRVEMAKLSLVQGNDTLYKENLADTRQWLKKNFVDDQKTKNFSNELDKLAVIDLKSQLPDISQSLKMLRDVTKLRLETDKALSGKDELPVQSSNDKPDQERVIPIQSDPVPAQVEGSPAKENKISEQTVDDKPDQESEIPIESNAVPAQVKDLPAQKSID